MQSRRSLISRRTEISKYTLFSGYGEEHAGIQCEMNNLHKMASIKIVYFQILPWHFRVYLHTLRVRINDVNIKPGKWKIPSAVIGFVQLTFCDNMKCYYLFYFSFSEYIDYMPSRDRERPTKLEIILTVPPDSIVTVKMEFDRVFLKWTEHPPDAHHGFYLP